MRRIRFLIFYIFFVIIVSMDGMGGNSFDLISRLSMGYSIEDNASSNYLFLISSIINIWVVFELINIVRKWLQLHQYVFVRMTSIKRNILFINKLLACVTFITICKTTIDVLYITVNSDITVERLLNVLRMECVFLLFFICTGIIIFSLVYTNLRLKSIFAICIPGILLVQYIGTNYSIPIKYVSAVPPETFNDFGIIIIFRLVGICILVVISLLIIKFSQKYSLFQM